MIISETARPTINLIGGVPNSPIINKVAGSRRGQESTMVVRSPEGAVERHTLFNARDLIRFHKWTAVSAPHVVNDHPDSIRAQTAAEAINAKAEAELMAEEQVQAPAPQPDANIEAEALSELDKLRHEYETVVGTKPDTRWGKKKMQEGIAAARKE